MAVVTDQGTAGPFDRGLVAYPAFGSRTPALHGFRLTFPAPIDHEIALIQVLPGGVSDDLSPNADLQPTQVPDGRLHVALQDANPSGEEFGYLVSHSTLDIPGARRFQVRDLGCVNKCVRKLALPSGGTPVFQAPPLLALVGFKLFFTGARDHELDRAGIWFRGNDLHVAFRDANGGDTFGYLVDFVAIPRPLLGSNISTGVERGSAKGIGTFPLPSLPRSDFLLTGWALNFTKDDQEILDIGVLRHQNAFTVFYADNGAGDEFDWRVEWAQIAPQVIA